MARDVRRAISLLFADLKRSPLKTFPIERQPVDAPNKRGVYIIYSPAKRVLHVGSTPWAKDGLAQRLRDHLAGRSSFTKKQFKNEGWRLRGKYKFRCLVVESHRYRAYLEFLAIGRLCPKHIGHGGDR
jgi:hypothetical protein